MRKPSLTIAVILMVGTLFAQEADLPADLRQHNLLWYNANLANATFSLDRNMPRSVALWSRWQWQSIDGDPTTLYFNYTQKLAPNLAGSVGYLQQNTGTFLQRGVHLNMAWEYAIDEKTSLFLGSNFFVFGQELANDQQLRIPSNEQLLITNENSFAMQVAPGIRLRSNTFNVGLSFQNALNTTLSGPDADNTNVFQGFVSNDFPLSLFSSDAYLRPQAYLSAVSGFDTQVGLVALLHHPNFWVQGGYNSYYGPSLGIGVTLAKSLSVGGLMEFSTGDLANEDASFEFVVSYFIGKQQFKGLDSEVEIIDPEPLPKEEPPVEIPKEEPIVETPKEAPKITPEIAVEEIPKPPSKRQLRRLEKRRRDSIAQAERVAEQMRQEKRRLDSINELRLQEKRAAAMKDSIAQVKAAELAKAKETARLDSIAAAELKKDVVLQPNERYEEVQRSEGIAPGFYLIANVFGTKTYYENFMKTLKSQGLQPGSFYRELNGYNYVYLARYNSIDDARKARDSKFNGKYQEKLWIFRVR